MKKILLTILVATSLISGSKYAHADISAPVAHYTFNEGVYGSTVLDSSGNGHNGTPIGADSRFYPVYTTDTPVNNYALSFNETELQGAGVNVGQFLDNDFTMTVSFWYKGVPTGQDHMLISKWSPGGQATGSGWGVIQFISGEDSVSWEIQNPGGSNWAQGNSQQTNDGQWHMITMVLNSDSTTGISDSSGNAYYIDGQPATLVFPPGVGVGTVHNFSNSNNIIIGGTEGGQTNAVGKLADVWLFDRALSQADVTQLYQLAGSSTPSTHTTISEHSSHTTISNHSRTTISAR